MRDDPALCTLLLMCLVACTPEKPVPHDTSTIEPDTGTGDTEDTEREDTGPLIPETAYWNVWDNAAYDISVGAVDSEGGMGILVKYDAALLLTGPFEGGDVREVASTSWDHGTQGLHFGHHVLLGIDLTRRGGPAAILGAPCQERPWMIFQSPFDRAIDGDAAAASVQTPRTPDYVSILSADMNGDGRPDILTNSAIALGPFKGTVPESDLHATFSTAAEVRGLAVGDPDGDGWSNPLLFLYQDSIYMLDGNLPSGPMDPTLVAVVSWEAPSTFEIDSGHDLTGDGLDDVVDAGEKTDISPHKGYAYVIADLTGGPVEEAAGFRFIAERGSGVVSLASADFDGDGQDDLAIGQSVLHVLVFPGPLLDGVWSEKDAAVDIYHPEWSTDESPDGSSEADLRHTFGHPLAAGDLDADGRADLVIADMYDQPDYSDFATVTSDNWRLLYIVWGGGI
jgi:hypothetical protein